MEHALQEVDEFELPKKTDSEVLSIPELKQLTPEIIEDLRADPNRSSNRYRMYLAWRRFSAIRLKGQGYTYAEIGTKLGVSPDTIAGDIRVVRKKYDDLARKDWAAQLEDRIFQIDADIAELRRLADVVPAKDIDQRLRILDRIMALETRRDKITGLDKAAASQHVEQKAMTVKLSFDQNEAGFVRSEEQPVIDVQAIE